MATKQRTYMGSRVREAVDRLLEQTGEALGTAEGALECVREGRLDDVREGLERVQRLGNQITYWSRVALHGVEREEAYRATLAGGDHVTMPNPTPTPTPALTGLPEEIRDALENSALASFHCGGWREGDEEPFRVVYDRAEAFKARLVAAITAALSQGAEDAAQRDTALCAACDAVRADDPAEWVEALWTIIGTLGPVAAAHADEDAHAINHEVAKRSVIDAALSTARAGEVSHG